MSKYCTKCGFQNDNDDLFCVSCGNPLKPAPQLQTAPQSTVTTEHQSAPTDAAAAANKPNVFDVAVYKRKVGVCILLSFITLGIYAIYWQYLLVKNVRAIKGDDSSCTGEMLCLLFVPFYSYYWWFTRGDAVKNTFLEKNHHVSGSGVIYLVLALFGLSIVSAAIMQNDFNNLPGAIEGANGEKSVLVNADTQKKKPMGSIAPAILFIIAGVIVMVMGRFRIFTIIPYTTLLWILEFLAIGAIAAGLFIKNRIIIAAGAGILAVTSFVTFINFLEIYDFFTEFSYVLTPLIFAVAAAAFACTMLLSAKKPLGKFYIVPSIIHIAGMVFHFIVWAIVVAASYGIDEYVHFGYLFDLLFSSALLVGYILAAKWLKAEEINATVSAEIAENNKRDENTIS